MMKMFLALLLLVSTSAVAEQHKTLDKKFFALAGTGIGLMALDYEMTQHCLSVQHCTEANPLLPSSRAGMYAAGASVDFGAIALSFEARKHHHKLWWLPVALVIAAHAEGVGSNIRVMEKHR